ERERDRERERERERGKRARLQVQGEKESREGVREIERERERADSCSQAGRLARYNKRGTITSREIQTAARLILPGELAKHAVSEVGFTTREKTERARVRERERVPAASGSLVRREMETKSGER